MNILSLLLSGGIAACVFASSAHATITVVSVSGTANHTITQNGSKFDITVTMNGSAPGVLIQTTAGEHLGIVNVSNFSSVDFATVTIRGDMPANDPAGLDSIFTSTVGKGVAFGGLRINGDLGTVNTTRLLDSVINGDITGDITLLGSTFGPAPLSGFLQNVQVAGDILGDIRISDPASNSSQEGTLDNLDVGGSIGTPALHVDISVEDFIQIGRASCRERV